MQKTEFCVTLYSWCNVLIFAWKDLFRNWAKQLSSLFSHSIFGSFSSHAQILIPPVDFEVRERIKKKERKGKTERYIDRTKKKQKQRNKKKKINKEGKKKLYSDRKK